MVSRKRLVSWYASEVLRGSFLQENTTALSLILEQAARRVVRHFAVGGPVMMPYVSKEKKAISLENKYKYAVPLHRQDGKLNLRAPSDSSAPSQLPNFCFKSGSFGEPTCFLDQRSVLNHFASLGDFVVDSIDLFGQQVCCAFLCLAPTNSL